MTVLTCAEAWIRWIDHAAASMPEEDLKSVFAKSENRWQLIDPYEVSDEEFVKNWLKESYETCRYEFGDTEYYTDKGERVRSKSEVIIANTLSAMGIPYKYEKPLQLKDQRIIFPDFTILDPTTRREIYLEHFGMMDDAEYAANALDKMILLEKNGYWPGRDFIFTMGSSRRPLDTRLLRELLIGTLKQGS